MPRKDYYWKNKEKIKQQEAERYVRDRDRILARNKAWNAANPESLKKSGDKYTKNSPERALARFRKYYWKNVKAINAKCREYQKRNPEIFLAKGQKRRSLKKNAEGSFSAAEWKDLCKFYKNRCLCCGKKKKLTADHVVPLSKGGTNYISNIQPLCGPCNSSKRDKTIDYRRVAIRKVNMQFSTAVRNFLRSHRRTSIMAPSSDESSTA